MFHKKKLLQLSVIGLVLLTVCFMVAVEAVTPAPNGTVNGTKNVTAAPSVHRATMGWKAIITLIVIIVMLFMLTFQLLSVGAAMIGSATFLWLCTVIHGEDIFSGMSNPGVLAVGLMFIIVGPLSQLGVVRRIIEFTLKGTGGVRWPLFKLCLLSLLFSPLLDPIPQVAMQVPLVKTFALEMGLAPSMLLMPMDFAILIANWAVIGASNNLVCSGLMSDYYGKGMEFFEPIKVSGAPAIFGLIYLVIFAPLLLPQNKGGMFYLVKNRGQEFILQVRVSSSSPIIGKTLEEVSSEHPELAAAVSLVELTRGKSQLTQLSGHETMQRGDILCFVGAISEAIGQLSLLGLDTSLEAMRNSFIASPTLAMSSYAPPSSIPAPRRTESSGGAEPVPTTVETWEHIPTAVSEQGGTISEQDEGEVEDMELTNMSFMDLHLGLRMKQAHDKGSTKETAPKDAPKEVTHNEPIRSSEPLPSDLPPLQRKESFISHSKTLDSSRLFEVVLSGFNAVCGATLDKNVFRARYGCAVLAIRTVVGQHDLIGSAMMEHSLAAGDTLLVMGPSNFLSSWTGSPDFMAINSCGDALQEKKEEKVNVFTVPAWFPFGTPTGTTKDAKKTIPVPFWYPYLTMAAFIAAIGATIGGYPLYETALLAVCFMVLVGIIDTYKAISLVDWNAWIIVAFSFGIGKAVSKSGLGTVIGQGIADANITGFPLLLVISFVTTAMANIVTNKAAIQVVFPIVYSIYKSNGKDPLPGIMVLSAMSVMPMVTPHGIPANILIVGPGGYSPLDFLKFGLPLNVLMAILHPLMAAIVYNAW